MKLLYINDELATGDGSNYHAMGMLKSFESILGKDNVRSFPQAEDGSGKPVNHAAGGLRQKLKGPLQYVRYFRKKYLSVKRSKAIIADMKAQGFIPTHIIARSTVFDTTAIYVARAFGAKLIYEFNTPEFYERGVIKKEPLIGEIETWEKDVIEASDYVYINSNVCRDMICDHYQIDKKKFIVIPNGYMSELYIENEEQRQMIRKQVRSAEEIENKFVVTFVGSLKVWHGIKTFCDIAEIMENNDSIRFLVLGDGEMHDMISDYTNKHYNMIFKGKVDLETMKKYLYASDLGIMPYEKKEHFYYSPLKMFDMIGAGLPFIGTKVGQIEEYCYSELSNEFLCNDSSVECFKEKIEQLGNDEFVLKKMRNLIEEKKERATWDYRANNLISEI